MPAPRLSTLSQVSLKPNAGEDPRGSSQKPQGGRPGRHDAGGWTFAAPGRGSRTAPRCPPGGLRARVCRRPVRSRPLPEPEPGLARPESAPLRPPRGSADGQWGGSTQEAPQGQPSAVASGLPSCLSSAKCGVWSWSLSFEAPQILYRSAQLCGRWTRNSDTAGLRPPGVYNGLEGVTSRGEIITGL